MLIDEYSYNKGLGVFYFLDVVVFVLKFILYCFTLLLYKSSRKYGRGGKFVTFL